MEALLEALWGILDASWRKTDRKTDGKTCRKTDRKTGRKTDRKTSRKTDRKTGSKSDREINYRKAERQEEKQQD